MTHKFKDLFISYGRRESLGFVGRLHQQLKLAGYDGWFDKTNIPDGDDYAQRINHGIESAHNFIYTMAPRCLTSPYCLIELEYARLLGKRVIPINHQVIFKTASQELSDGDKQVMSGFYQFYHLPDQNIQTTQDVLERSHALIGKTDWLAAQEKISDADCQRLAAWAQPYENNWAKHDDLEYLQSFEFPIFGEPIDALDGVVERLTAVLERQTEYVHQHTAILADALHWQQNQKATQHLLVGKERTAAEEWLLTEFSADKQPPCRPSALVCEFICEARKNAENMMTDIFICYDVEHDNEIRDSVVQSLSRYAKTTWRHDYDIQKGDNYEGAIEQGIENADNFFYFLSPHAVVSEYCQKELAHALKYNKRIVPLLIVLTPETDIPEVLRGLQYVDFTDNTCQADYDSDIDDILNILRHDHEYYEQHKVLLARALKWQFENYKPSFLLRGHNLDNAKTWLRLNDKRSLHPPTELHHKLITASEAAKGQLGTEVFVSYSRKDADFARHLNTALQEAGKTTWFDQESISTGVNFEQEIFKGIDGADNFLFVLSPDAVQSKYCASEVNYASEQNKRFISVLHRDIDPAMMPKSLQVINWIDFKDSTFNKSFPELIQALELDRVHAHQHTVLQQRASDWAENSRSGDFLLNITACDKAENWRNIALEENKQPAPTALQQDFIRESRNAIDAAERKERRRRNIILGSVTGGMIIAVILAGFAVVQMIEVERLYQEVLKKTGLTKEEATEMAQQFEKEKIFQDSLKDGRQGPEMVWLSAGQFWMGDVYGGGHENERPKREVSIQRFAMGRYEVTVGEFQQFVEATDYQTEAEKKGRCGVYQEGRSLSVEKVNWRNSYVSQTETETEIKVQTDKQPVVCVSWNDAVAYTKWLSEQTNQTYRLPSEAEWEYAARAGKEIPYWWGTEIGEGWSVCCGGDENTQTAVSVDTLLPNPFGLYHVTGNVEEWVADPWHPNYQKAPNDGRIWAEDGEPCLRVSRGGAWSSSTKNVRLASRNFYGSPDFSSTSRGFRLARSETPPVKLDKDDKNQLDNFKLSCVKKFYASKDFHFTQADAEKIAQQFVDEEGGRIFQDSLKDGGQGPEMVKLPAGAFQMGDIQGEGEGNEKPVHEVFVKPFAIGRYEVTFAEYDRFAEAMGQKKPDDEGWGRGNRPVINSWDEAKAYTKWLSEQTGKEYGLPSEAEWEYAARAGTETKYWWGNEIGENWANCGDCGSQWAENQTAPVGSFMPNPFGLYDTVGNVSEWITDSWHQSYINAPNDGSIWIVGVDKSYRVLRGGSWLDLSNDTRAAKRNWYNLDYYDNFLGFRVVRRVARTDF